jgi:hypothetical protein
MWATVSVNHEVHADMRYLCRMETRSHRLIGVGLSGMFGVFAMLQLNDPDPLAWLTVYGMLLVMVITSIFKPLPVMLSILTMLASLMGAIWLWPKDYRGLSGNMNFSMEIELARESLGLVICAGASLYLAVRSHHRTRHRGSFA